MTSIFRSAWAGVIEPLLKRPPALQLAALCWRNGAKGREVLLITSSNGRWILPKGWPIDGLTAPEAALQEAWEEAGVKTGKASKTSMGAYDCRKRFDSGSEIPCRTEVFEVEAIEVAKDYPESEMRKRRWVTPTDAAEMVAEPGLKAILAAFAE